MSGEPMWKPIRGAASRARRAKRAEQKATDDKAKAACRRRDKVCRFPLCGCRKLGVGLEVDHIIPKSRLGPSLSANMALLCRTRHQDSLISAHGQTLRPRFLTDRGADGPLAWEIDLGELKGEGQRWYEIARESAVQAWMPFTSEQRELLTWLAKMDV